MALELMINWIAVLVVSIIAFFFGFLWYGFLFMKQWSKATGVKDSKNPVRSMFIGFIITLISVYVLAVLIVNTGSTTITGGMLIGFLIWLGCSLSSTIGPIIWENKSMSLFWIASPYELISLLIVGGVLGYWL